MNITVPTSWNEISIGQFINLTKIEKGELDPIDYLYQVVSVCCKIPYETATKISLGKLKEIYSKLEFIKQVPQQTKIPAKISLSRDYVCSLAIEKISAGQYIDLKEYVKRGSVDNIHNILTVFYIPEGEKYNTKTPIQEIAQEFYEKLSIAEAYPIAVFFWNLVRDSMEIIRDSLLDEMTDQIRIILELVVTGSTSIGDGSYGSIDSQTVIPSNGMQLQK